MQQKNDLEQQFSEMHYLNKNTISCIQLHFALFEW